MRKTTVVLMDQLEFIERMHGLLRAVCLEPGTDEGHFVNENTVVRLAALLDAHRLEPPTEKKAFDRKPSDEDRNEWFCSMPDSERSVRVLFRLRHCIVHHSGQLSGERFADIQRMCYDWFCRAHPQARVGADEVLRLPFDTVISPLVDACRSYVRLRLEAEPG